MYAPLEALELASSPPRIMNGLPPCMSWIALPCLTSSDICACAEMHAAVSTRVSIVLFILYRFLFTT